MLKRNSLLLFVFCFVTNVGHAQTKVIPAQEIAGRVAIKMKDSLQLTVEQETQVYKINLQLNEEKKLVMQSEKVRDSIGVKLQRIENSRDLRYKAVLPADKYKLYLSKKRNLLSTK
jgi:hypothetical protein